jgi:hypothetical protein
MEDESEIQVVDRVFDEVVTLRSMTTKVKLEAVIAAVFKANASRQPDRDMPKNRWINGRAERKRDL